MPLDIAIGIIGALAFGAVTASPVTPWLLVFCIVCAVLPDADVMLYLLRGRRIDRFSHEHRNLMHYPFAYLVFGTLIVGLFDRGYALLFCGLSLCHFIHDSIGIGWGVRWLWPFSDRTYKFSVSQRTLESWTPTQLRTHAQQFGSDTWLRDHYMHLTPTLMVELAALVLALVLLVLVL